MKIDIKSGLLLYCVTFITSVCLLVTPVLSIDKSQLKNNVILDNNECQPSFEIIQNNINLGEVLSGQIVNLPTSHSQGNSIEIVLLGDSRKTYNVNFSMNLEGTLSNGIATITKWTWEKADYTTSGEYGPPEHNGSFFYNSVKLFQPSGADDCHAFAKFRMTADEISVSSGAGRGQVSYSLTVTATENN